MKKQEKLLTSREIKIIFVIFALFLSFFVRLTGITTYHKYINGEEAGLGVHLLEMNNDISAEKFNTIGRGYYHGFYRVYFYPLIKIFGVSLPLIKVVNVFVNMFAILTIIILLEFINKDIKKIEITQRNQNKKKLLIINLFFILFLSISTPFMVEWSAWVKPEFVETIIVGNVIFILTYLSQFSKKKYIYYLLIGILSGLSVASQPLIIIYLLAVGLFLIISIIIKNNSLKAKMLNLLLLIIVAGSFFMVGLSSLLYQGRYKNLNKFLRLNPIEGKYKTPISRNVGFFKETLPHMLSSSGTRINKVNTNEYLIYFLFMVFFVIGIFFSFKNLKDKDSNLTFSTIMLIGILSFIIILTTSNFMSFQSEPRRQIVFFSFLFPLIYYGISMLIISTQKERAQTIIYYLVILLLTLASIINSIKITSKAYKHKNPLYGESKTLNSTDKVTAFLNKKKINKIYTNTWIGNPITFSTKGKILWRHFSMSDYPSYPGYKIDNILNNNSAIILFSNEKANSVLKNKFRHKTIDGVTIYYINDDAQQNPNLKQIYKNLKSDNRKYSRLNSIELSKKLQEK